MKHMIALSLILATTALPAVAEDTAKPAAPAPKVAEAPSAPVPVPVKPVTPDSKDAKSTGKEASLEKSAEKTESDKTK